jgi:peptidyl-tRNA hydrolase, PTH1 family
MSYHNKKNSSILIISLGNPGLSYKKNRHNIGHHFIDYLTNKWQGDEWKENKKCLATINPININDQKIILAKSLVFMNQSGKALALLRKFYSLILQNIYIVHDDTDISLGNFKISYGRGSAGHKGIESIIEHFRSKNFNRIRIGVRSSFFKNEKAEKLVLKNLSFQENQAIKNIFPIIEEQLKNIYFYKNKQKSEKSKAKKCLKPKRLKKDN